MTNPGRTLRQARKSGHLSTTLRLIHRQSLSTILEALLEAVGRPPYFYDGKTGHEVACPACTYALFRERKGGQMKVKSKSRGKLSCLDESGDDSWQDYSQVVANVLENEPGKLN